MSESGERRRAIAAGELAGTEPKGVSRHRGSVAPRLRFWCQSQRPLGGVSSRRGTSANPTTSCEEGSDQWR